MACTSSRRHISPDRRSNAQVDSQCVPRIFIVGVVVFWWAGILAAFMVHTRGSATLVRRRGLAFVVLNKRIGKDLANDVNKFALLRRSGTSSGCHLAGAVVGCVGVICMEWHEKCRETLRWEGPHHGSSLCPFINLASRFLPIVDSHNIRILSSRAYILISSTLL